MELLCLLLVMSLPITLLSVSIAGPWQDSAMEYNRSEHVIHTELLPKVIYLLNYQRFLNVDKEDRKIQDLFNKPREDSDAFLNDVSDDLVEKVDDLIGKLNEPKNEARKEGINISDCVDTKEKELKDIKVDGSATLEECVHGELAKVEAFMIDLWRHINDTYDEVEVRTARMDECRPLDRGDKMDCLAQLALIIDDLLHELPDKITKTSTMIAEYVLNFRTYVLPKCALPILRSATICGETLLNDVGNCLRTNYPQIKGLGRRLLGCSPGVRFSIWLVVIMFLFLISL